MRDVPNLTLSLGLSNVVNIGYGPIESAVWACFVVVVLSTDGVAAEMGGIPG